MSAKAKSEALDATRVMTAEAALMDELLNWSKGRAPVVRVISTISELIDAKIERALREVARKKPRR